MIDNSNTKNKDQKTKQDRLMKNKATADERP